MTSEDFLIKQQYNDKCYIPQSKWNESLLNDDLLSIEKEIRNYNLEKELNDEKNDYEIFVCDSKIISTEKSVVMFEYAQLIKEENSDNIISFGMLELLYEKVCGKKKASPNIFDFGLISNNETGKFLLGIFDLELIITFDSYELDIDEQSALLNSKIIYSTGGNIINKFELSVNTFLSIMNNKEINNDQPNKLIIPLYISELFPEKIIKLYIQEFNINLILNPLIQHFDYKISCKTKKLQYEKKSGERQLIIQSVYGGLNNISFATPVQFIMFQFISKKCYSKDEYILDQPNIYSVDLEINGLLPLTYSENNLLQFEFLGIKYYILALIPNISSIEKIQKAIQNTDFQNAIKFRDMELKIHFNMDNLQDNYDILYTGIYLNALMTMNTMIGCAYSY
jgi:hypothetical protein